MRKAMSMLVLLVVLVVAGSSEAVIFEDDFGSYTETGDYSLFDASADWSRDGMSTSYDVRVGTWYGGRALYKNNAWGDTEVRYALATPTAGMADYVVSADGFVHDGYTNNSSEWYVAGRVGRGSYVRVGAVIAEADGNQLIYARFADSSGVSLGDEYVADYDPTSAIALELALEGSNVVGTVKHAGRSYTFEETTSVTGAGMAGMGRRFKWGYCDGYFDNFEVVPEPATLSIIGLGAAFAGLRRRRNSVKV